jgi:hypothetical protein
MSFGLDDVVQLWLTAVVKVGLKQATVTVVCCLGAILMVLCEVAVFRTCNLFVNNH